MQDTPGLDPNDIYTKEWHVDSNVPMSEDCLQLNIWTPMKTGEERLPVMVWIFGGGLQVGYPSEMEFDGERFARRGVVFVSLNYRLNVFGFLAHPELTAENPDSPCANWGLLDQKAGLTGYAAILPISAVTQTTSRYLDNPPVVAASRHIWLPRWQRERSRRRSFTQAAVCLSPARIWKVRK